MLKTKSTFMHTLLLSLTYFSLMEEYIYSINYSFKCLNFSNFPLVVCSLNSLSNLNLNYSSQDLISRPLTILISSLTTPYFVQHSSNMHLELKTIPVKQVRIKYWTHFQELILFIQHIFSKALSHLRFILKKYPIYFLDLHSTLVTIIH